jgi:hypothetical protein
MKRLYIILLLVLAAFGCTSHLDQLPSDKLPPEDAIKTLQDLEFAVNGVYDALIDNHSYPGDFGLYADCKGGDLDFVDNPNHLQPNIILQTDQNSEEADEYYFDIYLALGRINDVMAVIDNVTYDSSDQDWFDDLKGQLIAMKALLHFDAARLFCQMPSVIVDINAPNTGVVISDKVYPAKDNPTFTRSTLKETYDFAKSKFAEALPLLTKEKNLGRMNYWAARAIMARMHLYLEEYNEALEAAIEVIDNNAGYTLLTLDNYLEAWSIENADEFLFEIRVNDQNSAQRESIGYFTNPEGYAEAAATDAFRDTIRSDTNDIRYYTIREKDDDGDNKAWYTTKYEGRAGVVSPLYVNNPKVIRLVEMYYIAAEALLKGGTATGAETKEWYINEVKRNRIKGYIDMPANSLTMDDILHERRIELFCENNRMFDLVRLKMTWDHPRFPNPLSWDDYRMVVAFPQREIEINPDLEQNPGY